jgi:hypothetical protein
MSNVIVKRRADHGDEGIDQTHGSFESQSEAENWIACQKGQYSSPGDYYIVSSGDMPTFRTTRGLPPNHRKGRVLIRHKEFGWMVAEWHFARFFVACGIKRTDGGPIPVAVTFKDDQVENALEWVGIP